jgi:hypothetical protein
MIKLETQILIKVSYTFFSYKLPILDTFLCSTRASFAAPITSYCLPPDDKTCYCVAFWLKSEGLFGSDFFTSLEVK